jgi:fructosamine-3-kinase
MLPMPLRAVVATALHGAGDASPIKDVAPLRGGLTSKAARIKTRRASYLLKWHEHAPPHFFPTEACDLALLHDMAGFRVPAVIAATDPTDDIPGFMLQEWIEARPAVWRLRLGRRLGARIAALHRHASQAAEPVPGYGLHYPNFFGTNVQTNTWDGDWIRFFREQRLRPQVALAEQKGLLPPQRRDALERLLERLPTWLDGVPREPALLHGDLWGGNVLCDPSGEAVLIDPCVYYGDREAELAYTDLYGDFPPSFYAAYDEVWPAAPDRAERRDLYNLYHLLGGLNAQGEVYGGRVDAVLNWYVGM